MVFKYGNLPIFFLGLLVGSFVAPSTKHLFKYVRLDVEPLIKPTKITPWRTEQTNSVKTLYASDYALIELHKVTIEDKIVNNWLFVEYPSHVNIVIRDKNGQFILLYERKYGLRYATLSTVGGEVNVGESPLEAAKREILEELQMEAAIWSCLGTYRVNVNRGGGFVSLFFAIDCM